MRWINQVFELVLSNYSLKIMAYYAIVERVEVQGSYMGVYTSYINTIMNASVESLPIQMHVTLDLTGFTVEDIQTSANSFILAYATTQGYTPLTANDIVWASPNLVNPTLLASLKKIATPWSFNNTATHSFVTTAAAANGFQLSTTRDAFVSYSASISTSVSLSGNSSGYVVLEIASTNSSTASNWKEISRVTSGQSGTLVVGLTLNQVGGGSLVGDVPAGYYARLRTVNVSGTPTYTYNSGQEILI